LPAEIANVVDNFNGARAGVRKVAAVENQVGQVCCRSARTASNAV
jgi:hypothetical protein